LPAFNDAGTWPNSVRPHVYIKRATKNILVNNEVLLERIVINPKVMVGKPVIRGTRLTVEYILGLLAHGSTMEKILVEYPGLEKDDIYACLLFASRALQDASFVSSIVLSSAPSSKAAFPKGI
jgi:uncharacterized protein (DUF433 family)